MKNYKLVQIGPRIPDFMKDELESLRVNFMNKHKVEISFNAYIQHLLQVAMEVQREEDQ